MAIEPLRELVEESLDEAVFLWHRWEGELSSLTRNLDETWTWTEDRLQGALDGVRVAGDAMPGILRGEAGLESDDLRRVIVAAHLLAAGSTREALDALGSSLRVASGPRLFALARGIETAELDGSFAPVAKILATQGPAHSAVLCRIKAFRRANPAMELADAWSSGSPPLQVEAVRAAGYSSDPAHRRILASALQSEHAAVRRAAIEGGVRAGSPDAWQAAIAFGQQMNPESASMLSLMAMLGAAAEHQVVLSALRKPHLRHAALSALAYVGTPEAVEVCITGMKDPALARAAAESYCAITGADLDRDHLSAPEPEPAAVPFEADDLDADLVPKPDELWPLPDVEAVRRHWHGVKERFTSGARLYRGEPASLATLVQAVETGPMLRRPGLVVELGARTQGKYDVEHRAFARVQRRMMGSSRTVFAGTTAR
jgi:uncharacterized protein (TIGR02270 family)